MLSVPMAAKMEVQRDPEASTLAQVCYRAEDEVFPDELLQNGYVGQSLDASTSPLVAHQMPTATIYPLVWDDLMDIGTQPYPPRL